jgi:hypothetical protein
MKRNMTPLLLSNLWAMTWFITRNPLTMALSIMWIIFLLDAQGGVNDQTTIN